MPERGDVLTRALVLAAAVAASACVADVPVDPGSLCAPRTELLRDPLTGECRMFQTGGCADPGAGAPAPRYPSCESACEGLAEASCLAQPSQCHAAYGPDLRFDGCWAKSDLMLGTLADCDRLDAVSCTRFSACASMRDIGPYYRCVYLPAVREPSATR